MWLRFSSLKAQLQSAVMGVASQRCCLLHVSGRAALCHLLLFGCLPVH
jgi:hypothetical protein